MTDPNHEDKSKIFSLTLRCNARGDGLEEAWKIINILHMQVMDEGESWPRALNWMNQWAEFMPDDLL